MDIGGHCVETLLVEAKVPIAHELYAAIVNDQKTQGPLLLFSQHGGMDIEDVAAAHPNDLLQLPIDIRNGIDRNALESLITPTVRLYRERDSFLTVRSFAAIWRI